MSAPAERVACLAFDSPGISFLEQGLEAGRLPTLAGLLERGRPLALADRQEICTPTSWPTLLFGADLPDHGISPAGMSARGESGVGDVLREDARREPFWRHLD